MLAYTCIVVVRSRFSPKQTAFSQPHTHTCKTTQRAETKMCWQAHVGQRSASKSKLVASRTNITKSQTCWCYMLAKNMDTEPISTPPTNCECPYTCREEMGAEGSLERICIWSQLCLFSCFYEAIFGWFCPDQLPYIWDYALHHDFFALLEESHWHHSKLWCLDMDLCHRLSLHTAAHS